MNKQNKTESVNNADIGPVLKQIAHELRDIKALVFEQVKTNLGLNSGELIELIKTQKEVENVKPKKN